MPRNPGSNPGGAKFFLQISQIFWKGVLKLILHELHMDEHDDYSFEWLRLKDYDYWRLYLKEDQHPYLGRCVALNRREEA